MFVISLQHFPVNKFSGEGKAICMHALKHMNDIVVAMKWLNLTSRNFQGEFQDLAGLNSTVSQQYAQQDLAALSTVISHVYRPQQYPLENS